MSATIIVVMGVSGSGKSTVAQLLADKLGWDLQEGDDLHPQANVDKMASGVPLTDTDRWPWLHKIAAWIDGELAAGRSGIVTCSALKRSYRDILRRDSVLFVHLAGSPAAIADRIAHRHNHFMPSSLLESQLATLEPLGLDENGMVVDITGSPAEEAADVLQRLGIERG